ncbi:transposase [Streptomyces sp. NPDC127117]|uniref:transposase n=1 Tax=Streptomyces sp. NPDC127117 TaxID=3345368 RepID=UPI003631D703
MGRAPPALLACRLRRPVRQAGPARAGRRPHRPGGHRLAGREQAWRDAVQYVVMTCARSSSRRSHRVLPQAALFVDHFHLVRLVNQTLTEVRRRVTVTRRGRKGNREWEPRNRLIRSAARKCGEHVDALLDELSNLPRVIGAPITVAWNAKEDLLGLLAAARSRPDREQVRDLLYRFYRRCADADLPEPQRPATTVETWRPEILAFLHTGITNAGSEGVNRVIKTIARDAYGFRDPGNQRSRTRCATTRRARGHLDARNTVEPAPCNRVGWRHRTVSTAGVRLAVAGS